jgi:hypothetical protein
VYETTGKIETTFQHDGVKVRVEARELPRGGIGNDRRAVDLAFGGRVVKLSDHRLDVTGDFPIEGTVVTEETSQDLGEGEDHLPVRKAQQQALVHVLSKQQGAFLGTGWAEVEDLTAKGTEELGPAIRVGAADAGHALGIVAALEKALDGFGDPL